MKNLFDTTLVSEVKSRVAAMRPESNRLWGTMTPAQALEHCSRGFEIASGDRVPPRMFVGRLIGSFVKPLMLKDDAPMRRNSPTVPDLVVTDARDLHSEQARLSALIDRFATRGPQGCTTQPHSFFGRMTPDEWAILMYKHVDHHLRQFGV